MPGGKDFGHFVRLCRESLGYSLRKVAQLSEEDATLERITPGNLAMIERGRHIPSFAKILTLSRIYLIPLRLFEEHYWMNVEEETWPGCDQEVDVLLSDGWKRIETGQLGEALQKFRYAVAATDKSPVGDTMRGEAPLGVALCLYLKGHLYAAREELERLLAETRANLNLKARAGLTLAQIYRKLQNSTVARLHAVEALRCARDGSGVELRAWIHHILADIDRSQGDARRGAAGFRKALRLTPKTSMLYAAAQRGLALCLAELDEHEKAEACLAESMETAVVLGVPSEAARAQLDMAALLVKEARGKEAGTLARGCLLTARDLQERELEIRALSILQFLAKIEGDTVKETEYRRSRLMLEKRTRMGVKSRSRTMEDWVLGVRWQGVKPGVPGGKTASTATQSQSL